MSGFEVLTIVVSTAAAVELVAFGGVVVGLRRLKRRERHLEQLWDRHRRAVERDVAYLHEWQDFLGSYAGDISEDERG